MNMTDEPVELDKLNQAARDPAADDDEARLDAPARKPVKQKPDAETGGTKGG
jgi:hypothetical protein